MSWSSSLWFVYGSAIIVQIGKAVKFNPTDKEVENVTLEDCKVRSFQLQPCFSN